MAELVRHVAKIGTVGYTHAGSFPALSAIKQLLMKDLFGNKIVQASRHEPIINILERAGIELLDRGKAFSYNGKTITAPNGDGWERKIENEFKIVIQYTTDTV